MPTNELSQKLIDAALALAAQVNALQFAPPTERRHNPLDYAWRAPALSRTVRLLRQEGGIPGMNPGPGMAQCGVPGEIACSGLVGVHEPVSKPQMSTRNARWMALTAKKAK